MIKKSIFLTNIFIILFFCLIILSPYVKADETAPPEKKFKSGISSYSETGKRSTAEDYEEEDGDDDYTYSNYQVKFKQDLSERFGYDVSSFRYIKDYDSSDALDNKSQIYKINWFCYIRKQKERSLKFDLKILYKEKGYYDSPEREFSQFMLSPSLTFKKEGLYALNLLTGFNKYDYITADQNDQLKYLLKIDWYRYFMEKKWMITGYHAAEYLNHTQIDRVRLKNNRMVGLDYVPAKPYIQKIEARFKWGQRDTKDDDEHDEDSDYKFRQYNVKTSHKICEKLSTGLQYDYFIKDYNVLALDHKGFYIVNGYDYEILEDKAQRAWLDFDLSRKDTRYIEKTGNDYRKIAAAVQLNYSRKKNWKASLGIEGSFYRYDDEENDKERYYAKLSGEKHLFNSNLNLNADLKYRFTDYGRKLDDEQGSARFGMSYEF